ncbi:hypothetical protein NCC78_29340, partial [Micromonospora phytophila]|uniref:hypothetical protein n=1 Tax=Micromonospora phytophila TaxID=709888 RepID=UPI00202E4EB3
YAVTALAGYFAARGPLSFERFLSGYYAESIRLIQEAHLTDCTRAVDCARSATSRSVASYRRTSAGARASRPAAARTARSTEVGTLTPPVTEFGATAGRPQDLPPIMAGCVDRTDGQRLPQLAVT